MRSGPYHHGDLPAALRAAAVELVAERGPSGFSMREVARRAGVSHAAPAHHFGDTQGLLTSVAAEGYARLGEALAEATEGIEDPEARLLACGRTYVRTALENPGHFAVIFQADLVEPDDEACLVASVGAYGQLQATIELIRDRLNPDLDVDVAATMCWATMQGLVVLAPKLGDVAERTQTTTAPLDELIARMTVLMIDGFAAGRDAC
jgi:AcrR family transcriptional regulator